MVTAYLSLGSNVGDRRKNLTKALRLLEATDLHISRLSSIYETAPRDLLDQPSFLNIAVEIQTSLKPDALLQRTAKIETELGRQREISKGPRTIDIDMLLYGDRVIVAPSLEIPHPRMAERRFVLEPLAEICPDVLHPATGLTIAEMLPKTKGQGVERIDAPDALQSDDLR